MAIDERPESVSTPIISEIPYAGGLLRQPRPAPGVAFVLEDRRGNLRVLSPDESPLILPRPAVLYAVSIARQRLNFTADLPSRDPAYVFKAVFSVEWRVLDPVLTVRNQLRDFSTTVWPDILGRARHIARNFDITDVGAAEAEVNSKLGEGDPAGIRYGLQTQTVAWLEYETQRADMSRKEARRDLKHERAMLEINEKLMRARLAVEEHRALAIDAAETREVLDALAKQGRPSFESAADLVSRMIESGLVKGEQISEDARKMLLGSVAIEQPVIGEEEQQAIDSTALEPAQAQPDRESGPLAVLSYDDLLRTAFAALVQPGRLLFNPPDRMQLRQTARIEVRLTRTVALDSELSQHLRGPGDPQVEQVMTSPLMAVTLAGDGFKVTPFSDEDQRVTDKDVTTWEFDIQALKRGKQRLILSVSLRVPIPGHSVAHQSIPVREAVIEVQIGAAAAAQFVSANWQWFVGTAIAIGGVIVVVFFH